MLIEVTDALAFFQALVNYVFRDLLNMSLFILMIIFFSGEQTDQPSAPLTPWQD